MATPVVIPKPGSGAVEPQDEGLAALQRQLREQGEEVNRLRQAVKVQPKSEQPAQPAPQSKEAIETMFWKDPLPMMDAIAKRAAYETEQRIQANTLPTQIATARDKIRSADPEVFDLYNSEIEAAVNGVQEQFRGNLNVWQNAFNIVKGQHSEEIIAARIEKNKGTPAVTNQPTDGPAAPSSRQPPPPKEKPLNAEELEVSSGLGLTPEEYRRGKDRYNNQDREWNKVITFSSVQKRKTDAAAKRKSA